MKIVMGLCKVVFTLALLGITLIFIAMYTASLGNGYSKSKSPPEGPTIEFIFIGDGNTFLAKVGNTTQYYEYKFSGKQPKIGKYRIVGIGNDKLELIPIPDTAESSK